MDDFNQNLRLLKELVEINSGTHNVRGVNEVQDRVEREMKKLEFEVESHYYPNDPNSTGRFLVGTRAFNHGPFINLVMHADTVFERDSGFLTFTTDLQKNIATGPGVIDDKGGIVVALAGVSQFLKASSGRLNLRFVCAPTEETGSQGFHQLLSQLGKEAWMVLGFEPSREDGAIIKSRSGNRWYHIVVDGKSGHAGRDHAKGVDAGFELAHKLSKLYQLTDYKKHVSVSVGQLSGGSKVNIICGKSEGKLDVRFADFKNSKRLHKKITDIIKKPHIRKNQLGELPQSSWSILDDCPPFQANPKATRYINEYQNLIKKLEHRSIEAIRGGGAADSNYMSHEKLIIIDGLGPTGGGMHRTDEFIHLESLNTRSAALGKFLEFIENSNAHKNKSKKVA